MAVAETNEQTDARAPETHPAGDDCLPASGDDTVTNSIHQHSARERRSYSDGFNETCATNNIQGRTEPSASCARLGTRHDRQHADQNKVDDPHQSSIVPSSASPINPSTATDSRYAEQHTQICSDRRPETLFEASPPPVKKKGLPKKRPCRNIQARSASKSKKKVPQNMQAQWRIGAAPSVALTLTREEAHMTKILAQATAFHCSMSDVFWGPSMHQNPFVYDLDNRIEVFRDSSVAAACLVAAGRSNSAQKILDKVLPSMDDLFQHPPPGLYLILAELALSLVRTPNDALRCQITRHLSGRALQILGPDHPITVLLTLQLPQSRKDLLAERLWKTVLPILSNTFGLDHYQFSTQVFCHARNAAACGRLEEAIESIEGLIDRWSLLYGGNSLIVCYTKIELANILVAARLDLKAELVVSDALRTSEIIHAAELRNEDCPATEKRHRESSIAFPRVAGLRTLGRLHRMRGNLGAAAHYYSQAVSIGSPLLGGDNAAVELAQNDLDSTRHMELQQSLEQCSMSDSSNSANIIASPIC